MALNFYFSVSSVHGLLTFVKVFIEAFEIKSSHIASNSTTTTSRGPSLSDTKAVNGGRAPSVEDKNVSHAAHNYDEMVSQ
jgi:hypothetical protein